MKLNRNHRSRPTRLLLILAVAAFSLACKGSDDTPATPPEAVAGAGGEAEPGGGASSQPQGGATSMGGKTGTGEGGDANMPGAGGGPTEPGSWDESFWDEAVWQ